MVLLSTAKNILIIGIGPHARKNHLPVLLKEKARGRIARIIGLDTSESAAEITAYNINLGHDAFPIFYIPLIDGTADSLPQALCDTLDFLADRFRLDGIVISTHPSVHRVYTQWAILRGLPVLLDKPVSVRNDCSTDPIQAVSIHDDYIQLARLYETACLKTDMLLSVHCQRRYHPAFIKMRQLIADVAAQTRCPVTHIQSFHSDGQWRMPDEWINIPYHSYDCGYGKAAHSGYHFFDIVPWLMEAAEMKDKKIDTATVNVQAVRPMDLLGQLPLRDYDQIFPGFSKSALFDEEEIESRVQSFGEVDASVSVAFKSAGSTITLASINLLHNGFSQRGSMFAHRADLYKGNGRVRHETHVIHQGPFQAIYFTSLQTNDGKGNPSKVGGRDHVEVDVFRNNHFCPSWDAHKHYDLDSLTMDATHEGAKPALPTQAVARERSIEEFVDFLHDKLHRNDAASDFLSHNRSSALMSAAYLSLAQQWNGGCSSVTVDFSRSNDKVQDN